MTESNLEEERVYLADTSRSHSLSLREVGEGTQVRKQKTQRLPGGLLSLVLSQLSDKAQDYLPRESIVLLPVGWSWRPVTSILKTPAPTDMSTGLSDVGNPLIENPFR